MRPGSRGASQPYGRYATRSQGAPPIRLDQVTVTNPGGRVLLDDITLDVPAGSSLGVVGVSGAGKTTLIRLLSADPLPQLQVTGSVTVDGIDLRSLTERQRRYYRSTRVGVVNQHPANALNPTQRVAGAVLELLPSSDRSRETAVRLLAEVDLPGNREFLQRRTHQLSGGQRQRLAIARTLANRPGVVLLDEPSAELDHTTRDFVLELLARRTADSTTLIVAHDQHVINTLSDHSVAIHRGRLTPSRPLTTIARAKRHDEGASNAWGAVPAALEVRGLTVSHVDNRSVRRTVLDHLDLTVAPGETLAITGASGVGKTTLVRAISGLHRPDAGTITLHGEPLAATIDRRSPVHRRDLQLIPQDPATTLPPTARVLDIVARPAIRLCGLDRSTARHRAAELLVTVGLREDTHHHLPHELSGGERQRAAIARALVVDPAILICDEITSALDPDTANHVIELLGRLRDRRRLGLLVVTHDPEVVARLADRVMNMTPGSEGRHT